MESIKGDHRDLGLTGRGMGYQMVFSVLSEMVEGVRRKKALVLLTNNRLQSWCQQQDLFWMMGLCLEIRIFLGEMESTSLSGANVSLSGRLP